MDDEAINGANEDKKKVERSERVSAREKVLGASLTFEMAIRSLAEYMEIGKEIKEFVLHYVVMTELQTKLDHHDKQVERLRDIEDAIGEQLIERGLLLQESASHRGKTAADARHNKLGGSREKREVIRSAWASGKYSSRDICAEQECAAIGMSFSAARKALRGTPNPS